MRAQWAKIKEHSTLLKKSMNMDKSMSKISTNLKSNKIGLNIDPINPEIFEFVHSVKFQGVVKKDFE